MKPIPMTTITFELPIVPHQLRKLRGAVVENMLQHRAVFEAAEVPTYVFHNHKEQVSALVTDAPEPEADKEARFFDYPQIQYQVRHRRAQITGIGAGAQALQLWLSLAGTELTMSGERVPLTIREHQHAYWHPTLSEKTYTYRLNKWLPFSAKQFHLWKQNASLADKAAQLDRLLWGHLFHAAEGLGLQLDRKKLQLFVSTIDWMGFKDCFGIQKQALDITFCTNLNLPDEIGLGQGVSIGFGKVQRIKKNKSD